MGRNGSNVTDQQSDELSLSAPLVAGLGLVAGGLISAGTVAAGVSVTVSDFDVVSLVAGVLALALLVWGLYSATRGTYRRGVGALAGGAGFVMVFLAPQARSAPLFAGTGALTVTLSGLFLIAVGLGYVLVTVDDTEPSDSESSAEQGDESTDEIDESADETDE